MVEMIIEAIRINVVTEQHVVILREADGSRIVPIWIDPYQAQSIAMEMHGTEMTRPMTHDLLRNVINEMGGRIMRIVVNDLRDGTFYALIDIETPSGPISVDARPSDAIALGVRVQAPVFVEDMVLDQAGVSIAEQEPETPHGEEAPDDERLSVFRDFINNLDVDDPKPGSGEQGDK